MVFLAREVISPPPIFPYEVIFYSQLLHIYFVYIPFLRASLHPAGVCSTQKKNLINIDCAHVRQPRNDSNAYQNRALTSLSSPHQQKIETAREITMHLSTATQERDSLRLSTNIRNRVNHTFPRRSREANPLPPSCIFSSEYIRRAFSTHLRCRRQPVTIRFAPPL